VNEHLCPDIPENMFVTCLYGVLEPATGRLVFANAGHNLPVVARAGEVTELRARGMPLGLMPGMAYEEAEATLLPGAELLLYSDGLVEAHDAAREMFGSPRLADLMASGPAGAALIPRLVDALADFTGGGEQEDDITLVTIRRDGPTEVLAEFSVASAQGNEREVIARLEQALAGHRLAGARLERLKTAVAEATMNAMEHGNGFDSDLPVDIRAVEADGAVRVRITDRGGARAIGDAPEPDLDAKLAGEQTPRGWGLFLIRNMVDEMHVSGDAEHHVVELVMRLEPQLEKGGGDGDDA
jgi:anti-sigma regulatory factor (Ser/Thr protein kinase)